MLIHTTIIILTVAFISEEVNDINVIKMKHQISITVDSSILLKINADRGLIPLSTFVNEKLKKVYAPAAIHQDKAGATNSAKNGVMV